MQYRLGALQVDIGPEWDVRLLWDTFCNYSDVLYLPDDKSLLVTVETLRPGRTGHSCAAIRYFKMSLRYWQALPTFAGTSGGSPSQEKEKKRKTAHSGLLLEVDSAMKPRFLAVLPSYRDQESESAKLLMSRIVAR